jgi:hypothetical protein
MNLKGAYHIGKKPSNKDTMIKFLGFLFLVGRFVRAVEGDVHFYEFLVSFLARRTTVPLPIYLPASKCCFLLL